MCGTVHCRCQCLHVLHKSTSPTGKHWCCREPSSHNLSIFNSGQCSKPNIKCQPQQLKVWSGNLLHFEHRLGSLTGETSFGHFILYTVWKQHERRVNHAWIFHEEQKSTICITSVCTQEDYRDETETCQNISEYHCALWIHNGPLYALSTQWAIVRSEYTVRRRRQTHWSNFILWVQNGPKTTLKSLSWWIPGVPVWFKTDCKIDPNVLHVRSLSPTVVSSIYFHTPAYHMDLTFVHTD